ncbi:hypothetical protein AGMMS50276_17170 [Synergistales bacterium]|nr:hypothetical protein AGMMS50276_17170 [Synergistales bacterium]
MGERLTQRKEQALKTKQQLYKKAISLFSKKGYNAVTVNEICAQCNVSKGAFYTHFASKHDIIIKQSQKTDCAQFAFFEALPKEMSSTEKLRQFVKFIGDHVMREKGFEVQQIIYAAELSHDNRPGYIIDERRPLYNCIKTIVEEGQQRGEFRSDISPHEIMNILVYSIRGAIYEWLITSGENNLSEMELSLINLLIQGLKT